MSATATLTEEAIITPEEFLQNWQGHRGLTRRVIDNCLTLSGGSFFI